MSGDLVSTFQRAAQPAVTFRRFVQPVTDEPEFEAEATGPSADDVDPLAIDERWPAYEELTSGLDTDTGWLWFRRRLGRRQ